MPPPTLLPPTISTEAMKFAFWPCSAADLMQKESCWASFRSQALPGQRTLQYQKLSCFFHY